jgi:hypothetical protein
MTIKYQIEALFYNIGWEVPNDSDNELYDTKEEAELELQDHLESMAYAVEMGYLEDSEAHDWRVAEVEVQE